MTDSHAQRTIRGVNWNIVRVLVQTFLSLGVGIIVARILPPADFGLLAVAMIFVGFAEILNGMGMGAAVVQRKNLDEASIRNATSISLLIGLAIFVLLWLCAGPIAVFFDDDRIVDLVKVLAFGLLLSALAAVSRGLLMRRLDFQRLFYIDTLAHGIGYAAITISLALADFGVWSLVWGSVASQLLASALVFLYEPLRLCWRLDRQKARELLGFGSGISINAVVNYCAANTDYFFIGKFLDQSVLGLYSRAFHLVSLPLAKIAGTFTAVMFSSYSEIQGDTARLGQIYLRVVSATTLIAFPVFTGLFINAEHLILGLYGGNWGGAVPAFQVLCLAGLLRVVLLLTGPVVQATGHVYRELRRQIAFFLVLAAGCAYAVPYGIEAVAWAVVLAVATLYLTMASLVIGILRLTWRRFFAAQVPGVGVSLVVLGIDQLALLLLEPFIQSSVVLLPLLVGISAAAYMLGFLFLPSALMGDSPRWLLAKFSRRIPEKLYRKMDRCLAGSLE